VNRAERKDGKGAVAAAEGESMGKEKEEHEKNGALLQPSN
jgi:hypothetical protein